ncbi:MAG: hypothetical protein JSS66_06310 [Armatimonadetes bacterium]|nr:hypothetical protein [Armatimonadota bacterium]
MYAVFSRHTHPTEQHSHSYSVAIVEYNGDDELRALVNHLGPNGAGLPEPYGHVYQWYGGKNYDLVAIFDNAPYCVGPYEAFAPELVPMRPTQKISVGDNRFVGYYKASDILG